MNKTVSDRDVIELLRATEEELAAEVKLSLTETDTRRLLHKLLEHQIEIEKQNKALQEALIKAEENECFVVLGKLATVAFVSINSDGTIHRLNHAASSLLRQEQSALIGQSLAAFVDTESRSAFTDFLTEAFHNVDATTIAITLRLIEEGSTIGVRIEPFADKSRGLCNLVMTDISAQNKVERAEENVLNLHQRLIDVIPSPIFYKDANGVYLGGNQAFDRYMGLMSDQYVGKTVYDIAPKELADKYFQADRSLLDNPGMQTYEASVVYADGTRHDVIFYKSTFENSEGKVAGLIGVIFDISERKKAEEILRESELNFRNNFENNSSVMLLVDPSTGKITSANKAAVSFFGFAQGQLVGMPMSSIINLSEEDLAEEERRVFSEGSDIFLLKHRLASGEVRNVEVHLTPTENSGRSLFFVIIHDVTERTQAESKLRLAATVFSHAREGIMITSADGTIIEVNDSFCQITGYGRDEVVGRNPRLLSSDRQTKGFYIAMWSDLNEKGQWHGEIWNRRKNGEVYAELLTISAVPGANNIVQQYVALFSDITTQKEHQRELERIAHYDALTALPNRVLLADRLQQAMAQTSRRGNKLAVAYLDIDGFKAVNDNYGHEVGDQLLMAVAARMKRVLREGDTLARLGGDEFVAVLVDLSDSNTCEATLGRLLAAAAQPLHLGSLVLKVSASLGVTYYPQAESVEADLLLRQADQAMYQAKSTGKNRYSIFPATAR